jgi:hypothetical protein
MKLWKYFLIAISVAILPFALVGVGQAQQLTCWGLRPSQTEASDRICYVEQRLSRKSGRLVESANGRRQTESANDGENAGLSQALLTTVADCSAGEH